MFTKDERLLVSNKGLSPAWEYIINNYPVYFVRYLCMSCGNFVEVSVKTETGSSLHVLPRKHCFHMVDNNLPVNKRMELFVQDYIKDV